MDIKETSRLVHVHRLRHLEPLRLSVMGERQFKVYVPYLDTMFISSYANLHNAPHTSYGIVLPDPNNRFNIKLCKLTKTQRWANHIYSTFFFAQEIEGTFERLPVDSWNNIPVKQILCRLTKCSNK